MDYDVIILGGGLVGCAVAYELSKYNLNIALIEKDYDIADDISFINTAIVQDGLQGTNDLIAKLQIIGNNILGDLCNKFGVPFNRTGSLIIAEDDDQETKLKEIYNRAIKRGVSGVEFIDENNVKELEPNLKCDIKKAIYSKNTAVICPYDLALAYAEIAFDNGVNFRLEEEVLDIQKSTLGLKVATNKNKFTCKVVVNTTPYETDDIESVVTEKPIDKITYCMMEKDDSRNFNHIVYNAKSKNSLGFHAVPFGNDGVILAVRNEESLELNDVTEYISNFIDNVDISEFSNIFKEDIHKELIMIDDSDFDKRGYIKVTGNNFSEVTVAPAIANMICETITNNLNCTEKKDFIDKRREFYRFKDLSNEERNEIIKIDPRYANIVCLCSLVTEAEIIDSIRRPLGARTVEGVKRRTGVTLGNCQGAYCLSRIISILARETNKKLTDIVKDSKNSKVIRNRVKEFDEM